MPILAFLTEIQGVKEFNVPELMHIGATLDSDEERLKLQLQECWATPSSNSEDETKYIFIENSCGIDEEINVYESLNIGIVRYLDSRRVI